MDFLDFADAMTQAKAAPEVRARIIINIKIPVDKMVCI